MTGSPDNANNECGEIEKHRRSEVVPRVFPVLAVCLGGFFVPGQIGSVDPCGRLLPNAVIADAYSN